MLKLQLLCFLTLNCAYPFICLGKLINNLRIVLPQAKTNPTTTHVVPFIDTMNKNDLKHKYKEGNVRRPLI